MPNYLYTRKSRALGDPDDPALLAAHLAVLHRLAAADGVTIAAEQVYQEIGSGESITRRPVFSRLLREWERLPPGSGGALYTMEWSRLSRGSATERGQIFDTLKRAGLVVRTPERTYDLSQPQDELLCSVIQAVDQNELARYRQRVKTRWDEMTRNGEIVTGGAPYGYRWDKNLRNLVPVPDEFLIVQALFPGALDRSTRQLSREFPLRQPLICQILRNPVYSGWPHRHCESYTYRTGCKGTRRLPRERWLLAEKPGTYPAAVSRELFEQVQVALDQRYRDRAKCGFTDGWCRDVLRFVDHHTGIRISLASHLESKARGARQKLMVYSLTLPDRPRLYVSRELVHQTALGMLRALLARPELLREALEAYRQQQALFAADEEEMTASRLQQRLAQVRQQIDELLRRELEETDPEEQASISRVRATKRTELRELQERLHLARRQSAPGVDLAWLMEHQEILLASFETEWEEYREAERRRLVNCVIASIDVVVEPVPGQRAYRREVVSTAYQPWLESYMCER